MVFNAAIIGGVLSFPPGVVLLILASNRSSDSFITAGTGLTVTGVSFILAIIVAFIIVICLCERKNRS